MMSKYKPFLWLAACHSLFPHHPLLPLPLRRPVLRQHISWAIHHLPRQHVMNLPLPFGAWPGWPELYDQTTHFHSGKKKKNVPAPYLQLRRCHKHAISKICCRYTSHLNTATSKISPHHVVNGTHSIFWQLKLNKGKTSVLLSLIIKRNLDVNNVTKWNESRSEHLFCHFVCKPSWRKM